MDKGLKPLEGGLADNMFSALIAAATYHLFLNTSLSENVPYAEKKVKVVVAVFFITYSLVKEVGISKIFGLGGEKKVEKAPKVVEVAEPKAKGKGKKEAAESKKKA
jgi:hypothetical protein